MEKFFTYFTLHYKVLVKFLMFPILYFRLFGVLKGYGKRPFCPVHSRQLIEPGLAGGEPNNGGVNT